MIHEVTWRGRGYGQKASDPEGAKLGTTQLPGQDAASAPPRPASCYCSHSELACLLSFANVTHIQVGWQLSSLPTALSTPVLPNPVSILGSQLPRLGKEMYLQEALRDGWWAARKKARAMAKHGRNIELPASGK